MPSWKVTRYQCDQCRKIQDVKGSERRDARWLYDVHIRQDGYGLGTNDRLTELILCSFACLHDYARHHGSVLCEPRRDLSDQTPAIVEVT